MSRNLRHVRNFVCLSFAASFWPDQLILRSMEPVRKQKMQIGGVRLDDFSPSISL